MGVCKNRTEHTRQVPYMLHVFHEWVWEMLPLRSPHISGPEIHGPACSEVKEITYWPYAWLLGIGGLSLHAGGQPSSPPVRGSFTEETFPLRETRALGLPLFSEGNCELLRTRLTHRTSCTWGVLSLLCVFSPGSPNISITCTPSFDNHHLLWP